MRTLKSTTHPFNRSYYRTVISFLLLFLSFTAGKAQTVVWTWVSGDNTANQAGVYGTKGTAAATNKPGNRHDQCGWKDATGNFWVFGGMNNSSNYFNDLWRYNPSTGQWTWISGDNTANNTGVYGTKGTAAATNKPGARYGQTAWTDASGNFWMYGGWGYDGAGNVGGLNDLWRYNTGTNQWTWISGNNTRNTAGTYGTKGTAAAANKPGGRWNPTGWVDASGNFWIFGGYGYDASNPVGNLNDLWRYNTATGQWTWMSGDNTRNNTGVYGTKGSAAVTNKPGSRDSHNSWIDASGNFWLFGGWDISNNSFNDLWKYNPTSGHWTWVSGDNTQNNGGVYGTKGTAAAANKPGARYGQNVVIDASGHFWIFAGQGFDVSASQGAMNDLWEYNPATGNWTWQSGDNTRNSAGVYGTKGTGTITNKPGGRAWATSWLDGTGKLWSFGGTDGGSSYFNDLFQLNSLTVLPLHDISLRGTHRNNENVLIWTTLGEVNTNQFTIERSANGTDFTAVGTLAAAGSGDHRYSYTDYNAIGVSFYYRIQVKDVDGQVYYSPLVVLEGLSNARISVYPNPARSYVVLQVNNSLLNTVAKLYDATGRLVYEFRISNLQQQIELHRFAKGVFTLQLNNGKSFVIIKE